MGRPPRDLPVASLPIEAHPHLLIAAPDHPLVGADTIRAKDILAQTLVMRDPGLATQILANRWLHCSGERRPIDAPEMDSNETIKQAVMAGLGIALILYHIVTEELRSGPFGHHSRRGRVGRVNRTGRVTSILLPVR